MTRDRTFSDDNTEPLREDDAWLTELLTGAVRDDEVRDARAHGEVVCPGPWDAHERISWDDVCPHCGAAL